MCTHTLVGLKPVKNPFQHHYVGDDFVPNGPLGLAAQENQVWDIVFAPRLPVGVGTLRTLSTSNQSTTRKFRVGPGSKRSNAFWGTEDNPSTVHVGTKMDVLKRKQCDEG